MPCHLHFSLKDPKSDVKLKYYIVNLIIRLNVIEKENRLKLAVSSHYFIEVDRDITNLGLKPHNMKLYQETQYFCAITLKDRT